jgi:hypothetical protein
MSVDFQRATRRYIAEDRTLQGLYLFHNDRGVDVKPKESSRGRKLNLSQQMTDNCYLDKETLKKE